MWAKRVAAAIDRSPRTPGALRAAAAAAAVLCAAPAAGQIACRFDSAPTSIVFTGYTPFGAGAVATTTLSYDCPPPVSQAWIEISGARVMTSGGNALAFQLYQEATNTNVWTEAPPVAVPPSKNGTVTVYALLPPQDAAAGFHATTLAIRIYPTGMRSDGDVRDLVVQADVPHTCVIEPATLAFGSYDPYGAHAASPLDAQGAIRIACTRGTGYAVGLGTGNNPSGATRQMASGAHRLQYQLHSDPGRTTAWDAISTVVGTAPGVGPVDLVVYGRVPGGQVVVAGPYQDVVQSTINF